jgi:predicted nucleic acid-binding protein
MAKNLILCDTNIIIEVLRNNGSIISIIKQIGIDNIAISYITIGELLWGARNKSELNIIQKALSGVKHIPINEDICKIFMGISENYCLSHNIGIPDSFIAASSIYFNYELFTLNKKDFSFIKGVRLYLLNENTN